MLLLSVEFMISSIISLGFQYSCVDRSYYWNFANFSYCGGNGNQTVKALDCEYSLFCSKISKRLGYVSIWASKLRAGVLRAPVRAKRETKLVSYSISEARHSADGPMAGHDDAHLSAIVHQHHMETRPPLTMIGLFKNKSCLVEMSSRPRKSLATNS